MITFRLLAVLAALVVAGGAGVSVTTVLKNSRHKAAMAEWQSRWDRREQEWQAAQMDAAAKLTEQSQQAEARLATSETERGKLYDELKAQQRNRSRKSGYRACVVDTELRSSIAKAFGSRR